MLCGNLPLTHPGAPLSCFHLLDNYFLGALWLNAWHIVGT